MKTGSRRAIATAALCLAFCATSHAAEPSSLVGIQATKTSVGLQLEIRTSAVADFVVDRFAPGDYLFIWAPGFSGPPGKDDIPLDIDTSANADLLRGVSLSAEGKRSGLKVFLGPGADRRGAFVLSDETSSMLIIPESRAALAGSGSSVVSEGGEHAENTTAGDTALQEESSGSFFIPRAVAPVAQSNSAETIEDQSSSSSEANDASTTEVEQAQEGANGRLAESGLEQGSIDDSHGVQTISTAAVPEETVVGDTQEEAEVLADGSDLEEITPTALANVFNQAASALIGQPTVNYQILSPPISEQIAPAVPPRSPKADKLEAEKSAREAEAAGEANDASVDSGSSFQSTYNYSGVKPGNKAREGSATVDTSIAAPVAALQASTEIVETKVVSGKDALKGVMIELFEIVNTPLDQALTLLIAPTDFNIIVDAAVSANLVSLSFKESKTDLRSALDLLTRTYGLDYVVEAGTIVVAPKDKVAKELSIRETRLFVLSYGDPKRVKAVIDNMGIVPSEQVVVYGGEDFTEGAKGGGAGGGGGALGGLLGGAGGAGGEGGSASAGVEGFTTGQAAREIKSNLSSAPPNSIMVSGTIEQLDKIEEVVKTLDRRPKIIELEVRVCEATETALRDLGVMAQDPLNTGQSQGITEVWSEAQTNSRFEAFSLGSMLRSGLQLTARLNTLIQDGKLETLAQPVLSTVEDKQANYFAGERIPYVKSISVTNNTITQTVEFLDVGITLAFKPRLDADGQLTIQVEPTISTLIEFVDLAGDVTAPRTLSRNVQAMVRVEDCEPFVLAGLITSREKETMNKVPLLSDMPLLGKLFRNKNKDNQRTEVIVIVTPHIR